MGDAEGLHESLITSSLQAALLRAHDLDAQVGEVDEADVSAITTFLEKGLTDQSRAPARPDEVPSGLAVPKDGFRIPR